MPSTFVLIDGSDEIMTGLRWSMTGAIGALTGRAGTIGELTLIGE